MNQFVTLCRLEEIPDGASHGFDPGGIGRDTLFVVRQGNELHGWYDRCPHEGLTPLPYRRHAYLNQAGTRIVCFAHGAQFDIATGEGLKGPCVGQSLDPVPLRLTSRGEVVAEIESTETAIATVASPLIWAL